MPPAVPQSLWKDYTQSLERDRLERDHACLDFIAAFQERHEETGGRVIMEWRSLIGRYTRGGIRAAARRSTPPSPPRRNKE